MTTLTIEVKEGKELAKKYSEGTIKASVEDPFIQLVLATEGEVKKATVVDTGRLRSSISHKISGSGFLGADISATIGTNVQYAPFIELGTAKMEPRHMEGSTKILGTGMLEYTITGGPMAEQLKEFDAKVVHNIERGLT